MKNDLPDPISFDTALEKFFKYLALCKRSTATITAYKCDLLQLSKYMNDHCITQATTVTTLHLNEFVAHLSSNGYIPKSVSRKLNSIKTFFKFMISEKMMSQNPADPVIHPKFSVSAPRILAPHEYKSLRDACRLDIRMSAVIELLLQTGIRIGELANLKLDDFRKNELFIRPLENNPERTIPLGKNTAAALQNYLAIRPNVPEQSFFITKTGHSLLIRNMRASVDRYFRLANIKNVKVNDLRHTFAGYQIARGVNPEYLARVLGHKRDTTVNRYLLFIKPSKDNFNKLVEL